MRLSTIQQPVATPPSRQPCAAREIRVDLPPALARFGNAVPASLSGADGAPVIIVMGGISADHLPCRRPCGGAGWWRGLAGEGCALDPRACRILGVGFAADPAGRHAPTTAEQAQAVDAALDAFGIERAHAIVGASYGGMVALAFAAAQPDRVGRLVVVSAGAEPHPSATAVRELQRRIVALGLDHGDGDAALSIARGLAMLTYRTPGEFAERFGGGISGEGVLSRSEPGAYLRARGDAYRAVMSPQRFLSLSASIDRHRVDPRQIRTPTQVIGALSDQLVPAVQLESLAARLAGPARLHLLPSQFGHDMFLKEAARLSSLVAPWLELAR